MVIYVALAYLAKWAVPIPHVVPGMVQGAGFVLVAIRFLLSVGAFFEFRKAGTTVDPHGSVTRIITSGVYRFTRNLIYLGFVLMLIVLPLNSGTVWGIVFVPFFVFLPTRLVIEREEVYLEKKFGEA
jgi:protein-S-isoprenylcysteine O-methyltransferase Ste14